MMELMQKGRLAWRLLGDQRVPTWLKVIVPLLVLGYFVFPLDFLPDFLPLIGQLDDLGVVLLGVNMIIRFSPRYVVEEHRRGLGISAGTDSKDSSGSSYWNAPPQAGQPTRRVSSEGESPIDGEYRVVRPNHENRA